MTDQELIAIMPLEEAKALKNQLSHHQVNIELNHQKKTCSSGCSITVEVHAQKDDIPKIAEILDHNFKNMIEDQNFNLDNLNQVFDPNAPLVTCPACTFEFSPTHIECPDCGLAFG